MSLDGAIPTLWSKSLLKNLNDQHVFKDLLSREYTGEITDVGDSVKVFTVGRVTVSTYTKNSTSITLQNPIGASVQVVVDQSNYFAFEIDDIDKVQTRPELMNAYTEEAAWGLADTCDADLATILAAGVGAGNILTAATSVGTGATDQNAYEILVDIGVALDEANVPEGGRWVVIPPWFRGELLKDVRFTSFGTGENRGTARSRAIGETVAGLKVYMSNNLPVAGSAYTLLAGVPSAAAFVEQIVKTEPFRPESSFSDALKGLHVYGRKVVDATRLVKIACTQAT